MREQIRKNYFRRTKRILEIRLKKKFNKCDEPLRNINSEIRKSAPRLD